MPPSEFYDVGPLAQVAINLFYGWGYNFYRKENQLRADDLLIRTKAASLLGDARASVAAAESAFRRAHFKPPTREKPFPDPEALAEAQTLERLASAIGGLIGQLHAAPAPESDRMSDLYRRERDVLLALGECDLKLIGQAELLRVKTDSATAETILAQMAALDDGLAAIRATLKSREAIFLAPA